MLRTGVSVVVTLACLAVWLGGCSQQQPGQPPVPDAAPGIAQQAPLPAQGPPILSPRHQGSGFSHPGVLVSPAQLETARRGINAGQQPWAKAFGSIRKSPYASLTWQPKPRAVVECGPFSDPDLGCTDETADAVAAYTHALLWYLTGNRLYAQKAAEIIDAWSAVLQTHVNQNAALQAGWAGASLARAAELLRHTYPDWTEQLVQRAQAMFRNAFLPLVTSAPAPYAGGNWELIMVDATVSMAVYADDRALFDAALKKWRARVRSYIYLASDGAYPIAPAGVPRDRKSVVSLWFGQSTFVDGLTQETCRDFGHTAWGLAAMTQVAETAHLQGIDLYGEMQQRITRSLELHASYELADSAPAWLCRGAVTKGFRPSPELAYNHFALRLGVPLPNAKKLVESLRPESAGFFYGWETLTHAANPA